ncbi:hypothetical protein EMCRGX_G016466 [Ephydatia muelleri]
MDKTVNKVAIAVEITSDVVCPWCWIGKKRLDLAIERLKDEFTFNVTWKPFLLQLIHNVPERGIPLKDYLWQKYGKGYAEDIFSANSSVNRSAAEVGIVFSSSRLMVPTKKAHMLLNHASKHGKQHELLEAIFQAYHCCARNINDDSVLIEIAGSVGLDPAGARGALHSPEALQDFDRAWTQSQDISGVPRFDVYLQDKPSGSHLVFSGSQSVDTFVTVFRRLRVSS